jgi:hypothetical protein
MKPSLKFLIITLLFGTLSMNASAQDYNTAIGVRGGWHSGLTVKHFLNGSDALEGLLVTAWKGFELTALFERHANAFGVNNLNWYYGAGGHVGSFQSGPWFDEDKNESNMVIGVDGILGLEYNIGDIPFNVSIDWKPEFNLVGYSGFWGGDGALSIRYTF